jgi:hypothetical protein
VRAAAVRRPADDADADDRAEKPRVRGEVDAGTGLARNGSWSLPSLLAVSSSPDDTAIPRGLEPCRSARLISRSYRVMEPAAVLGRWRGPEPSRACPPGLPALLAGREVSGRRIPAPRRASPRGVALTSYEDAGR